MVNQGHQPWLKAWFNHGLTMVNHGWTMLFSPRQVPAEDDPAPPDTLYAGVEYECMWQVKNVTLYKQVSAKWALSH